MRPRPCGIVRVPLRVLSPRPKTRTVFRRSLALAVCSAASASVFAEPLRYDYFDVALAADDDQRGLALRGSFDFGELGGSGLYLHGSAASLSGSDGPVDLDRRDVDLGLGYRHAIGDFWALEGELAWRDERIERKGSAARDVSGARLSFGVRGSVSERVELRAKVGAFDGGGRGVETRGEIGVHVLATSRIGFTTDVQFGDGGEVLMVGVRVRF